MLISGFTFARNTHKLGYPYVESIKSILPVCDEFIIAVGKGDDGDCTRERIAGIGDPKIKIIDTEWTDEEKLRGHIFSQQTNIALRACRGIWCFYLQSDEVVHEQYLDEVKTVCARYAHHPAVDAFLFGYKHFWGDYDHYIVSHKMYPREIRMVRNHRGIVSIGDAQSFRYDNGCKIPALQLKAEVFHYGHVRHPQNYTFRKKVVDRIFHGDKRRNADLPQHYDYGSLVKLPVYRDEYPAVMQTVIAGIDWKHLLDYKGTSQKRHGHDRFKYRVLTFIEQRMLHGSGREFWGNKQYRILHGLSRKFAVQRATQANMTNETSAPAASLIIAVYNRPDVLEKVFCSLRNQTVSNFEIVIADDGSGPEIADLVNRYQGAFPHRVKHVWHEDDGFRKTVIVNKAVTASVAPYAIFIDGDCILHHRFVEFHLKRKRRKTVLTGRRVMLGGELSKNVSLGDIATRRIEASRFWRGKGDKNRPDYRHGAFLPGVFHLKNIAPRKVHDILGANFSLYKEDFLEVNGYDERIIGRGLEDDNLSIRLHMAGIRAKTVCNEALQYHLHHDSSPIPHSDEFKKQFRDNPASARTPFGIVRDAATSDVRKG